MSNFFDGVEDLSGGSFELIPDKTLAWARVEILEDKVAQSGNKILKLKMHILGKYDGSFIFDNIIYTGKNSKGTDNEVWGKQKMKAILTTSKIPLTSFKGYSESINLLNGCIVGVKIGLQKPNDEGKVYNNIKTLISPEKENEPNPEYLKLVQEQGEPPLASIPKVISSESIDEDDIPFG